MILEELRNKVIDHRSYKFVVEICMDHCGLLEEVSERQLDSQFATKDNLKPHGFKDVPHECIQNALHLENIPVEKLPLLSYFIFLRQYFGITNMTLSKVLKDFILYISIEDEASMLTRYSQTTMMRKRIALQLRKRPEFDALSVEECSGQVCDMFTSNISHNNIEKNFMVSSQSALAYLTHYYNNFFVKSNSAEITKILYTKDFRMVLGDDKEVGDFSNYIPKEVHFTEPLNNFKELAYDILTASSYLYKHGSEVYYDLWSRFKFSLVQKKFNELNVYVNKYFPTLRFSQCTLLIDANFKHHVNEKYRKGLFNCRESLLKLIWARLENNMTPLQYPICYEEVMEEDLQFPDKNGRRLFGHDDNPPCRIPDSDLFLKILKGLIAVKQLAAYCEREGINPLSIPSDIFQSQEVYVRVSSFKDYLYSWRTSSNLLKQYNNQIQPVAGVPTNDEVARDLLRNESRTEYKLSALAKLKFSSLKDLITQTAEQNTKYNLLNVNKPFATEEFRRIARAVNNKFKNNHINYLKIIKLCPQIDSLVSSQLGYDFSLGLYRTTKDNLLIPTLWNCVPSNVLTALNGLKIDQLLPQLYKLVAGSRFSFHLSYMLLNLDFVLSYHITNLLNELTAPNLMKISIFGILEKYKDIIDLPIELFNKEQISNLLNNSMSNINKSSPYYDLLNVTLCTGVFPIEADSFKCFRTFYNVLMKNYYGSSLKLIKDVKEAIYKELHLAETYKASPFGKYHSLIMNISVELGTGVLESTAVQNSTFMHFLAIADKVDHNFLVYHGRAVYHIDGGVKYYVHKTGKLFAPELVDSSLAFTSVTKDTELLYLNN